MKKLFYIICAVLFLTSCDKNKNDNGALITDNGVCYSLELVDVCLNNETHQYVLYKHRYGGSFSHWEGCKYCKQIKDSLKWNH